jgi:branched-chain amino acid transport system substrate-binding protein
MLTRRAALSTGLGLLAGATVSGCSGASLAPPSGEGGGTLNIGFLTAKSGVYKTVGDDMTSGFSLYLKTHGHKLGGRTVNLIVADHSDNPAVAHAAAKKLIQQDRVVAAAGVVDSGSMNAVQDLFNNARIPLIGCNSASGNTGSRPYLWRSSYANTDPAVAIGSYVAQHAGGPVWIIMQDYPAGRDEDKGFRQTFLPAGGRIANPGGKTLFTPFPSTEDFQPYLSRILASDAKAVWCFYAGAEAISFVKQAHEFGLKQAGISIYAPGWMTDGSVLQAQGDAALGITTVDNYASDLDNGANREFVSSYQETYGSDPSPFAMASWDGALVLDKALAQVPGPVTSTAINDQVGKLGTIESPRGPWHFTKNRTPGQKWYLRKVIKDGAALNNVVLSDLAYLPATG